MRKLINNKIKIVNNFHCHPAYLNCLTKHTHYSKILKNFHQQNSNVDSKITYK